MRYVICHQKLLVLFSLAGTKTGRCWIKGSLV